MNKEDDGYFHYDTKYPPLYVKPPPHQLADYEQSMHGAVLQYLQESYKLGQKHFNNILSSGLSAGEAGIMYIRELNDRRKRETSTEDELNASRIMDQVVKNMKLYMNVDVNRTRIIWDKHIHESIFQGKNYKKRLLPAIKSYLGEIDEKTKGYTSRLNSVINSLA
jgi:hypothetical protein